MPLPLAWPDKASVTTAVSKQQHSLAVCRPPVSNYKELAKSHHPCKPHIPDRCCASSRVERAAEALWPKLFRSKWLGWHVIVQPSAEDNLVDLAFSISPYRWTYISRS